MKRVIIAFAVLTIAFCAFLYYSIVGKESEKKNDQTAAARKARWAKKQEPESQEIQEEQNEIEKYEIQD